MLSARTATSLLQPGDLPAGISTKEIGDSKTTSAASITAATSATGQLH